jgi:glycosyltransferase involved in cell wall biosynthesis
MRPKILFISGFFPSWRVPSGGQHLVYNCIKELSGANEIVVVAFYNSQERTFVNKDDFAMCRESYFIGLSILRRLWYAIRYPRLPLSTSARYGAAAELVGSLCESHHFDAVTIHFTQAASLLTVLPKGTPATLVVHDVFHRALDRRAKIGNPALRWFWRSEAGRTRRWESSILRVPTTLITLTEREKCLIFAASGRSDVSVWYPTVDECYTKVTRDPATIKRGTILYWGLMSRAENEDSVRWFLKEIFPLIKRERSHACFVIGGAKPGANVLKLASDDVKVLGYVDSPVALFSSVEMAVAPLRLGSGIKIKVVELLAAGIPTVATDVGAEGVTSNPLLSIENTPADFARRCVSLLAKYG